MNGSISNNNQQKSFAIACCYAREDEELLNKLRVHLRPLEYQGLITVWHDRNISGGAVWNEEIKQHLDEAQIILLLISPDFMNSKYCVEVEMPYALERHKSGEATVIPVILRHTYWSEGPLGPLQALPTDGEPVTSKVWDTEDKAFYTIVVGIRAAIKTRIDREEQLHKAREAEQARLVRQAEQAHLAEEAEKARLIRQAEQARIAEEKRRQKAEQMEYARIAREERLRRAKEAEQARLANRATTQLFSGALPLSTLEATPSLPRRILQRSKSLLLIAAVVVITCAILIAASINHQITTSQFQATATAQTVLAISHKANPYGGTLVISDPMKGPGSTFNWQTGADLTRHGSCNFINSAYYVSGFCDSGYDQSTLAKFAFEIHLSAGQNCGSLLIDLEIQVCENGSYHLNTTVGNAGYAMNTGLNQSNIIGVVEDGTHLTLYINYSKIAIISNNNNSSWHIVLGGTNGDRNNAEVVYTDARLWSL